MSDLDLMAEIEAVLDQSKSADGTTVRLDGNEWNHLLDMLGAALPEIPRLRAELSRATEANEELRLAVRVFADGMKRRQAEMELLRPVVEAAKAYREVFNTAKSALAITASRRELFRAVTALPAETWKPAEPWQTPGGLTPEDDPPQPIGDPPEDAETSTGVGTSDAASNETGAAVGATANLVVTSRGLADEPTHCRCPWDFAHGRRLRVDPDCLMHGAAAGAGQAGEEVGDARP